MLKQIAGGALAGALATLPQSATVWGLRMAGAYRRKAAPEVVAEQVTDRVVGKEQVPDRLMPAIKITGHVGYGAAGGAVYGAISRFIRPTLFTGLLAGLTLWALSYLGWLPATGIMPSPQDDERGRQATMLLAHIAYGISLGAVTQRLTAADHR